MKIIVNNIATEYQDEGAGPVLLFLHGWWDSLKTFNPLTPFLKDEYRIIRLDLPGFGGTETPSEDWNLDNYINFVSAFIKKINIPINILVGHSFGGRIIIKGLATNKLSANKIILIAPAGNARRRKVRNFFLMILAKIGKIILPKKIRRPFYKKISSDYANTGVLKNTFINIIKEDLMVVAEEINIPTLLIWGGGDLATPLSDGERFAKSIKGSVLKIIKSAGHFIHQEKPKEVAEIIKNFL